MLIQGSVDTRFGEDNQGVPYPSTFLGEEEVFMTSGCLHNCERSMEEGNNRTFKGVDGTQVMYSPSLGSRFFFGL